MIVFIFIEFFREIPLSKLCRPSSDAVFCGVGTGSALFAYFPQTAFRYKKGLNAQRELSVRCCFTGFRPNSLGWKSTGHFPNAMHLI